MNRAVYGVYGASGCGRGVMPLARSMLQQAGDLEERLFFIDDNPPADQLNGHPVLRYEDFLALEVDEYYVTLAIADGRIREQLAGRCDADGLQPWTVMAGNVVVMDEVELGEGAILSPFVTLTSNIRIGKHFQANLYSYVEHDCVIGDYVTLAPGVKCNGNVVIEDHAYIGAGAIIRQGKPGEPIVIGEGVTVGMGAVVTKSVSAGQTVVGNPARPLSG